MTNRTPAFRFSVHPFGSIDDGVALTVQVRRVDGDPDGGPVGLRTSPIGVELEDVLAELRRVLGRMRASDDATRPQPPKADPMAPRPDGWLLTEGLRS